MKQSGARQGCERHCRSPRLLIRKRRSGARFVVVLDETNELLLVRQIGAEVQAHALGRAMLQSIIEPLVVAVIEPLLLQLPFLVPVGLSDEEDIGVSLPHPMDHLRPVFVLRSRPATVTPRALEDGRHE
ncbi:MAG: hypothetical protein JW395_2855 [Nitrospira sp.]|nr:hypothetical protein [Nitrospira sp.]